MQAAQLIESRTPQWRQLEALCTQLESGRSAKKLDARRRVEFAAMYRSACADLSLADAYQLPAETVRYLHQLVGRAHNQLYRVESVDTGGWRKRLFETTPRLLFHDNAVRLAAVLFWGPFLASMFLASRYSPSPSFAGDVVGREYLMQMEEMHSTSFEDRGDMGGLMSGWYLRHNTSIGIRCFAWGLVVGVGGMIETVYNAVVLGAVFGHMTTVSNNELFFEFVTAHGPFELTAIVLAAAAGMKMGFALINTKGLRRLDSLMESARDSLPILGTSVALFFGAAFIEALISGSTAPYEFKAFIGMMSTLALLGYMVVLGFSQQEGESDFQRPATAEAPAKTSPFD